MLTNIFIMYVGLVIISTCLRLFFYDPKLLSKSKTQHQSAQDKPVGNPVGNPGDWFVKLRKPKREITVVGCNTEGEVVRKIILMGHQPDEIKDIIQL